MVSLSDLYSCMAAQVEVKLGWVSDTSVNRCACWDVAALANLCKHMPLWLTLYGTR